MQVIPLTPRGFCHGVVNAIHVVKKLASDMAIKRPITVLGMLVHNQAVIDELKELGVDTIHNPLKTRLELLDEVTSGTVVITAHGVSDQVKAKAYEKGLDVIDATCKDVTKSYEAVKDFLHQGYDILFIGKKNHPEVETVMSYENVYLVENKSSLEKISPINKVAVAHQTTLSLYDVFTLNEAILKKYPDAVIIDEPCDATITRQQAVMNQPQFIEHCVVVGDSMSHNAQKLVEMSIRQGIPASLVASKEGLDLNYFKTLKYVSITSAASTPTKLTQEVIETLKLL